MSGRLHGVSVLTQANVYFDAGGQRFDVPGDSACDIGAPGPLHRVCHFG